MYYLPYKCIFNKLLKIIFFFCSFAVDTNQKVHRFCNPAELTAYFKMYFEKERFNPLLGENLLKEYRYSSIFWGKGGEFFRYANQTKKYVFFQTLVCSSHQVLRH